MSTKVITEMRSLFEYAVLPPRKKQKPTKGGGWGKSRGGMIKKEEAVTWSSLVETCKVLIVSRLLAGSFQENLAFR